MPCLYRILFFTIIWCAGQAQPAHIVLLKQQLRRTTDNATSSRLLAELGHVYSDESNDSCFYWLNQSLRLARHDADAFAMARACYELGRANLYYKKDEAKAIRWLKQGKAIAATHKDNRHLAHCYRLLAVLASHQGATVANDADSLLAQASLYAQKSGDRQVIGDVYGTQHDLAVNLHKTDFRLLEQSLRLAMNAWEQVDPDQWMTCAIDYCELLQQYGKQAQAQKLAKQIARQTNRLKKKTGEFVYINDMARLASLLGRYSEAESILLRAIAQETRQFKPDTLHLYFHTLDLMKSYQGKGFWEGAFHQSQKLSTYKLWLQHKRQTRDAQLQMNQVKSAIDMEKKEKEIALLAARQKQQQTYLIAAVVTATLLLLFLGILYRVQYRVKRQKKQLTQLNATKDKLFAILSHDLRSPVANLQTNVMMTNWGALNQQEFAKSTQCLSLEIGHVRTMLDNLLSWSISQMDGIQPKPEPIQLGQLVQEQIQLVQSLADAKQIRVVNQIPTDATLQADRNHLSVICRNLLQNAIKFTHLGGYVQISFSRNDAMCQLTIQDTGLGMSPQLLEDLFRLDKQTSRLGTASEQGTGLGLVLVKELVDVNQGTIQVASEVGRGTTFTLTFRQLTGKRHGAIQAGPTYA